MLEEKYMDTFNIDKSNPLPLYAQLQRSIIKKIEEGVYKENESLPAEHVIIKQSGLSRTTVRQAIDNLEKEGYIEKRRGIGTFVSPKKKSTWDLEKLRSFREEFSMKGKENFTKLLEIKKIKQTEYLATIFGETEKYYYVLERLRYIDETPIIVVTTYVPESKFKQLDQFDFNDQSLFTIMEEEYHTTITFAEKEFRAKIVTKKDATLLMIEEGDPIQEVRTKTYDDNGELIEYSVSRDRGDLSVHKVRLNHKNM